MIQYDDRNTLRIAAIDWLRGLVMILMVLDHTSGFFNTGRIFADSVLLLNGTSHLFSTDQFFTRWITHICAPTFIFLTGTSIAISNRQCCDQGIGDASINHELLLRGTFIALLDLCVFSLANGKIVLQVLYTIGVSMMLMAFLRRLGTKTVFFISIMILACSELLLMNMWEPYTEAPLWLAVILVPIFGETYSVLYPVLPWLAVMMLGWVFGEKIMSQQSGLWRMERLLIISGLSMLIFFGVIRSLDAYGNMFMYLEGDMLVQWLYVSKYPPSLAYILFELGLMIIILALLARLEIKSKVNCNGPILVFGQTALFFYLSHFGILMVLRLVIERGSLEKTYWISILVLIILYPICRIYRSLKWQHPLSLLRFI